MQLDISLSGKREVGAHCTDFQCVKSVLESNDYYIYKSKESFSYKDKTYILKSITPDNGVWCAATAIAGVLLNDNAVLDVYVSGVHWTHHVCRLPDGSLIESNYNRDLMPEPEKIVTVERSKVLSLFGDFIVENDGKPLCSKKLASILHSKELKVSKFKKKCTAFIDADELRTLNSKLYLTVGDVDSIAGDKVSVDKYIKKQGSGVVAIQLMDDVLDLYSPSKKGFDKYKTKCRLPADVVSKLDTKLRKHLYGKVTDSIIVNMVDLHKCGRSSVIVEENGLLKKSRGNEVQTLDKHDAGTWVVLESDDCYLVAKDSKGLPINYKRA